MSVRATERLVGDVVIVSGLENSPKMVVQGVDIDAKLVTTIWFSDDHQGQVGIFPASSLDRYEVITQVKTAGKAKAQVKAAPGKPGRKPGKK
ncbi:hypothetical protein AGMMS50293_28410 [Spirochaetia bacterium]|nr:hypothetical protein AGMMS50293_28410 [Spirochaetia bacterium]